MKKKRRRITKLEKALNKAFFIRRHCDRLIELLNEVEDNGA